MSPSLATVCYIAATILFILSLGGLSNPESSRRGNLYGMIGMAIAVLATVFGPRVTPAASPFRGWPAAGRAGSVDNGPVRPGCGRNRAPIRPGGPGLRRYSVAWATRTIRARWPRS